MLENNSNILTSNYRTSSKAVETTNTIKKINCLVTPNKIIQSAGFLIKWSKNPLLTESGF